MGNSNRLNWPFPDRNQDPFYDTFKALVDAQDATGYANREDRNLILAKGGTFTWNAGTSTMTWSATLEVVSSISGYHLDIAAGSATIADGSYWYTTVTRAPLGNGSLTAIVGTSVPNTDDAYVIAVRVGTELYFRNGHRLVDGASESIFSSGSVFVLGNGAGSAVHNNGTGNDSSGQYSLAQGEESVAGGQSSVAMGTSTFAAGNYGAFTAGDSCTAPGESSAAFGDAASAAGPQGAFAVGNGVDAPGESSFAQGDGSTASGDESVAFNEATATGFSSFACNYSVAHGEASHAEGTSLAFAIYSHAQGSSALALRAQQDSFACGDFSGVYGSAQTNRLVLRGTTPGSASTEAVKLFYDPEPSGQDPADGIALEDNKAYAFKVTLVAGAVQGANRVVRTFEYSFNARRASGTTLIIATSPNNTSYGDASTNDWTFAASVGVAPDRISFTFTTGATHSITKAVARVEFTEALF